MKMKWTEVPAGELNAAEQRLRVALGESAGKVVRRINTDPLFLRVMVGQLATAAEQIDGKQYGSINPNWQRAHKIMGDNFFGVEEAMRFFGVDPSNEKLANYWQIPYAWTTLRELKNTHILVAVFPLTITMIMNKVGEEAFDNQVKHIVSDYRDEPAHSGWLLIRKTAVPGSLSKEWNQQYPLITKKEHIPRAVDLVYAVVGYYLVTGKRLLKNIRLRTSTTVRYGKERVLIGQFDKESLNLGEYALSDEDVGLASYCRPLGW